MCASQLKPTETLPKAKRRRKTSEKKYFIPHFIILYQFRIFLHY